MKTIRNNKVVKDGSNANVLKMLVGLFYLATIEEGKLASIRGKIIEQISFLTGEGKASLSSSVYEPVLDDYFIKEFDGAFKFPDWDKIKANEEGIITVCEAFLKALKEDSKAYYSLKTWFNEGKRVAVERLEKRKLEEQIPKSRINDIEALVKHYQTVEEKLRTFVYDNDKLKKQVSSLEKNITELNKEKAELEKAIKDLHGDMDEKNKDLDKAKKEIGERKALNEAFDALKKNDEGALLRDIANDLKAEYRDFIDSENDTMDVQLGEIYREKIKNIFKILEKKGVKVEQ
jgi:chromosome segregation ATPase